MIIKRKSKINKNKTKYVSRYTNINKTKLKNKSKPESINVYAKNMRYMIDDVEHKKLLTQLSNTLGENQWLKVSKDKYEPKIHSDKIATFGLKPKGSWYSKGEWLFHDTNCCNLDNEIILIEVDYSRIYRITGKEPYKSPIINSVYKKTLKSFAKDYGTLFHKNRCGLDIDVIINDKINAETKNKLKNICKTNKSKTKCNNKKDQCQWESESYIYNLGKLYKKYDGFSIYPYPELELMEKKSVYKSLEMYDVSSLVLWNHTPVIKHYNLGTIREIIKDAGVKGKLTKEYDSYLSVFIPKLIEKIKELK